MRAEQCGSQAGHKPAVPAGYKQPAPRWRSGIRRPVSRQGSSPVKQDASHAGVLAQQRPQDAARAAANVRHSSTGMLAPVVSLQRMPMALSQLW